MTTISDPVYERRKRLTYYAEHLCKRFGTLYVQAQGSGAALPSIALSGFFIGTQFSEKQIRVESLPEEWPKTVGIFEALADRPAVAIIGDPGSGKSTLVSYLIEQLAQQSQNPVRDRFNYRVAIPFILREMDLSDVSDWDTLLRAWYCWPGAAALLDEGSESDSLGIVEQLLAGGHAYILVDGFDEAPGDHIRQTLADAFAEGQRKWTHPGNRWLATSRPVGYDAVPFPDVTSLEPDDARESESEPPPASKGQDKNASRMGSSERRIPAAEKLYIAPFRDDEVAKYAGGWYGARSKSPAEAGTDATEFLRRIRSDPNLAQMSRMPQMLSLMCLVYQIDRSLPYGRADLFQRVTKLYLEQIPTAVKAPSKFPLRHTEQWLARVGFEMQRWRASAKTESDKSAPVSAAILPRAQILGWIIEEQRRLGHDESDANDFLRFVSTRGGLFLERGVADDEPQLAFLHLAFQEYFAALYIRDTTQWVPSARSQSRFRSPLPVSPLPVSLKDLLTAATQSEWQETFLMLFELYPEHLILVPLESLLDHGAFLLQQTGAEKFPDSLGRVISRTSLNPLVRLNQAARTICITELLRWEAAGQAARASSAANGTAASITGQPLELLDRGRSHIPPTEFAEIEQSFVELELSGLPIDRLAPIQGLTQLTWLYLSNTQVQDLAPLKGLTKLTYLNLRNTPVQDLAPLKGLTKLTYLDLNNTKVQDLAPLQGLKQVTYLYLFNTQVTKADVEALKRKLPNCTIVGP